jgi:hypothetical protein
MLVLGRCNVCGRTLEKMCQSMAKADSKSSGGSSTLRKRCGSISASSRIELPRWCPWFQMSLAM